MNLLLLAVIVIGVSGICVGLMYSVRRWSTRDHLLGQIEHGSGILAVVGTAFAVVLAFVVLEAFDNFNEARTGGEVEASAILELSRNADFFPVAERRTLEGALVCYARAVVEDEWPLLADGARSSLVDMWLARIRSGLLQLHPRSPREEGAFLQLLGEQDSRLDARRVRLSQAVRAIPAPVWFILALAGGLTIAFLLLFADRRESFLVQGSVMAAVSAMVAAGLLLVYFLDHPYSGQAGSLRPDDMELVAAGLLLVYFLDHPYSGQAGSLRPDDMELVAPIIASENAVPAPCTEGGEPRPA